MYKFSLVEEKAWQNVSHYVLRCTVEAVHGARYRKSDVPENEVSIPVEIKRRDAGRKAVDFLQHDRLTASLLYKKRRSHERIRKNKTV